MENRPNNVADTNNYCLQEKSVYTRLKDWELERYCSSCQPTFVIIEYTPDFQCRLVFISKAKTKHISAIIL